MEICKFKMLTVFDHVKQISSINLYLDNTSYSLQPVLYRILYTNYNTNIQL